MLTLCPSKLDRFSAPNKQKLEYSKDGKGKQILQF